MDFELSLTVDCPPALVFACLRDKEKHAVKPGYSGILTQPELAAAVQENIAAVRTHGTTRLLADCTRLEGGHSIAGLYFLAASVELSDVAAILF